MVKGRVTEGLKRLSLAIVDCKRRVGELLEHKNNFDSTEKSLFMLSIYAKRFVSFEPFDQRAFQLELERIDNQSKMEMELKDNVFRFHPDAFVLKASGQFDSLGDILWVSSNGVSILGMDKEQLSKSSIDVLMPFEVRKLHKQRVVAFLQNPQPWMTGSFRELWMVDSQSRLSSARITVKPFHEPSVVSFFSFIQRLNSHNQVLVDEQGFIQEFGCNFETMAGLPFTFANQCKHLTVFPFMPQMIVRFLSKIYGIPDFVFEDSPMLDLCDDFVFVFAQIESRLLALSNSIEMEKGNRQKVAGLMFDFLNSLKFENLKRVFRVKMKLQQHLFSKSKHSPNLWSIQISDFENVTSRFKECNFTAHFWFVNKLNLTPDVVRSISTYNVRKTESIKQNEELDSAKKAKGNQLQFGQGATDVLANKRKTNPGVAKRAKRPFPKNPRLFSSNIDERFLSELNRDRTRPPKPRKTSIISASQHSKLFGSESDFCSGIPDTHRQLKCLNLLNKVLFDEFDFESLLEKEETPKSDWVHLLSVTCNRKNISQLKHGVDIGSLIRKNAHQLSLRRFAIERKGKVGKINQALIQSPPPTPTQPCRPSRQRSNSIRSVVVFERGSARGQRLQRQDRQKCSLSREKSKDRLFDFRFFSFRFCEFFSSWIGRCVEGQGPLESAKRYNECRQKPGSDSEAVCIGSGD